MTLTAFQEALKIYYSSSGVYVYSTPLPPVVHDSQDNKIKKRIGNLFSKFLLNLKYKIYYKNYN